MIWDQEQVRGEDTVVVVMGALNKSIHLSSIELVAQLRCMFEPPSEVGSGGDVQSGMQGASGQCPYVHCIMILSMVSCRLCCATGRAVIGPSTGRNT
jgi:hypothetical protein